MVGLAFPGQDNRPVATSRAALNIPGLLTTKANLRDAIPDQIEWIAGIVVLDAPDDRRSQRKPRPA